MKAGVAAATIAAQDSSGQEEMFQSKKSQSGLSLALKGKKGQKPASSRKGRLKQTQPSIPPSLRFVFKL